MITKLYIDKEVNASYKSQDSNNCLDNLNHLNIFIGANNTGKSRFLRSLFADRNPKLEFDDFEPSKLIILFEKLYKEIDIALNNIGFQDVSSSNITGLKATLKAYIEKLSTQKIQELVTTAAELSSYKSWLLNFQAISASNKPNYINISGSIEKPNFIVKHILNENTKTIERLIPENFSYRPEHIYIPILRGLRPTQWRTGIDFDEKHDNYLLRTLRDYFNNSKIKEEEIFTGIRLYSDTKKMLLGKQDEREKIKKFESFLSKTFFNNEQVTLIPNIQDDSIHVSIGTEEHPIYELGDGIQSIIILLYPLFFNQGKKMCVFIEEPENSMHPGLQRLFLETIMQDTFSSFQYFITTHSNHFLDLTLDLHRISIYTFKKQKIAEELASKYLIENTSNENKNILTLIGVRNSSVFLSNCTIWVEGITDRLYIKKYLELYQHKISTDKSHPIFKEDYNYSFIEYGGGNIVHWEFGDESIIEKIKATKISSKIFVIADRDSTDQHIDSAKSQRHKQLKNILGDNFQTISGREIENIISPSVLVKTIKLLERKNVSQIEFDETKIIQENYLDQPLGKFISDNFKNLSRKYKAESGTLNFKLDFCRVALENMEKVEDISKHAYKLAEKIYKFIHHSNVQ